MSKGSTDLVTAAKIAKELGVSPSVVRQALAKLKIKPKVVKGGCSYYDASVREKIEKTIKSQSVS